MGECAVSCEAGIQLELEQTERSGESERPNAAAEGGGVPAEADGGVRWERFLPKMTVRVLLVEADDSTRQIIAALLRKCSYRVAAVADGLKAWEVLKRSPCNIDLILTEVELSSISGYALLTLIMEHEVCKNIPVIMMSSQDSVSTVYKCMLKGATDFLVKPVRKNELRNLWQHVWRKQASTTAGIGPPDESVQQMIEITSENNNATSNHSSGHMSCIQKNKQCTEKGSDAQSSCTKPVESGTEGENIEHGYCFSQPKSNKCLSDEINISGQDEYHGESMNQLANDNETRDAEDTCVFENSSREAIDLIGTFDDNNKGTFGIYDSNVSANKFDILPFLDLSLRRAYTSESLNQVNDVNPGLNHSDASAFSRYINKPVQLSKPTSPVTFNNQQKDEETSSEKQSSNYAPDNNHVSIATFQTGHPEITFPRSQNTEISHRIPVRGVRFEENTTNAYNSVMIPSIIHAQSGSSLSSPPTPHHTESLPQLSPFNPSDHQKNCNSILQKDNRLENMEDRSGNSNFCIASKGNEESLHVQEGVSQKAMQREAALYKFRMKRKDRCFDKKVRYESRKKLAEQRPRVKGQFVRQVPSDNQPGKATAAN